MNKKFIWPTLLAIAIFTVLVFGLPTLTDRDRQQSPQQNDVGSTASNADIKTQNVSITVQGILEDRQVAFKDGQTALQALQNLNDNDPSIQLSVKEFSGLGTLVESLGGISNGTDGKYWHYKVNGALPMVGADQYKLLPDDKLEWYFITPDEAK
ncbi:DUF4430 domain-containing protein [bacterium]|nr:MAG: DUF4430 domain-containing protein [bacterium]